MASNCKRAFEVITIVLTLLDIIVGWLSVHEMYGEIQEHEGGLVQTKGQGKGNAKGLLKKEEKEPGTCEQPDVYWTFIFVFEGVGTILDLLQIYFICCEMRQDKRLRYEGFRRAFVVMVLIYVLSVFPSTFLEILYRKECACEGMYIFDDSKHYMRDAQHLRRDIRRNVRDLTKGLLGGVCVIFLQCLMFIPEIYEVSRKFCDVCSSLSTCCELSRVDDVNNGNDVSGGEENATGSDKNKPLCFLTSVVLSMTFVGLFISEIFYIFCIPIF